MVSSCIHSLRYISITGRLHDNTGDRSRAHWDASQIYVQLFDNPSCARDVLSTGKNSVFENPDKTMSRHAGLSADEEKKAKKRAKKAQQKQEEQKKGAV
jgi:hypothetical protein